VVARIMVARIMVARIMVARIMITRIMVRLNIKITGNRRIPFKNDYNIITPPMPTKDNKVIILNKCAVGFT
jgi:hypothetical protein